MRGAMAGAQADGTLRIGSTSITPGRCCDVVHGARADRGSTKVTVASCRIASVNCWSISTSMTSMNARPTNSTATANAMPTTEISGADRLALEVAQDHPRRRASGRNRRHGRSKTLRR